MVLIFCYILPGVTITITSFTSMKTVLEQRKLRRIKKGDSMDLLERNYLKVCAVSTALFYVLWTPYAIVDILTVFNYYPPKILVTIAAMFAKLSAVSNVLINCFINKNFKGYLNELYIVQCFTRRRFQPLNSGTDFMLTETDTTKL